MDHPFGPASDGEKVGRFEQSTLDVVLGKLGYSASEIAEYRRCVGDPELWNFEWFNGAGFVPFAVEATRVFRFDLAEAFFRPTASKLLKAYWERRKAFPEDEEYALIVKVAGWGRVVLTDVEPCSTSITVRQPSQPQLSIVLIDSFFNPWRRDV